jgi:hypothetical protein
VADHVPPSSVGPGRMGPGRIGPGKIGRKRLGPSAKGSNLERGESSSIGRDPSMIPKGHGVFGRIRNVDKDGDPFTRRSPHKKPGNDSFF